MSGYRVEGYLIFFLHNFTLLLFLNVLSISVVIDSPKFASECKSEATERNDLNASIRKSEKIFSL